MTLRVDKRAWALGGLTLPRGVAVVRRGCVPANRSLPRRMALVGGRAAEALRAPLGRIVTSSGGDLSTFVGLQFEPLLEQAMLSKPDLLLVAAPRMPNVRLNVRALWLGPATFPRCSSAPGTPLWYGAWAAQIWRLARTTAW